MQARLTPLQLAFVKWYVILLNATRAAEKAGYKGNDATLAAVGYENLRKPHIRAAINEIMKEIVMPPAEILMRLEREASADISVFFRDDLSLNMSAVREYGYLIKSIKKTKDGYQIATYDAQNAKKLLGQHYAMFTERIRIETPWYEPLILLFKDGKITQEELSAELGNDLATEFFKSAGVPIISQEES